MDCERARETSKDCGVRVNNADSAQNDCGVRAIGNDNAPNKYDVRRISGDNAHKNYCVQASGGDSAPSNYGVCVTSDGDNSINEFGVCAISVGVHNISGNITVRKNRGARKKRNVKVKNDCGISVTWRKRKITRNNKLNSNSNDDEMCDLHMLGNESKTVKDEDSVNVTDKSNAVMQDYCIANTCDNQMERSDNSNVSKSKRKIRKPKISCYTRRKFRKKKSNTKSNTSMENTKNSDHAAKVPKIVKHKIPNVSLPVTTRVTRSMNLCDIPTNDRNTDPVNVTLIDTENASDIPKNDANTSEEPDIPTSDFNTNKVCSVKLTDISKVNANSTVTTNFHNSYVANDTECYLNNVNETNNTDENESSVAALNVSIQSENINLPSSSSESLSKEPYIINNMATSAENYINVFNNTDNNINRDINFSSETSDKSPNIVTTANNAHILKANSINATTTIETTSMHNIGTDDINIPDTSNIKTEDTISNTDTNMIFSTINKTNTVNKDRSNIYENIKCEQDADITTTTSNTNNNLYINADVASNSLNIACSFRNNDSYNMRNIKSETESGFDLKNLDDDAQ